MECFYFGVLGDNVNGVIGVLLDEVFGLEKFLVEPSRFFKITNYSDILLQSFTDYFFVEVTRFLDDKHLYWNQAVWV